MLLLLRRENWWYAGIKPNIAGFTGFFVCFVEKTGTGRRRGAKKRVAV